MPVIEGVKFEDGIDVEKADQVGAGFNLSNPRIDNSSDLRPSLEWLQEALLPIILALHNKTCSLP